MIMSLGNDNDDDDDVVAQDDVVVDDDDVDDDDYDDSDDDDDDECHCPVQCYNETKTLVVDTPVSWSPGRTADTPPSRCPSWSKSR